MNCLLMGAGLWELAGFGTNDWLHIEQRFVDANFQDSGDDIFCLARVVAPKITDLELTKTHIPWGAGNDLKREPLASPTGEVLIAVVSRASESALHKERVSASAPWTEVSVGGCGLVDRSAIAVVVFGPVSVVHQRATPFLRICPKWTIHGASSVVLLATMVHQTGGAEVQEMAHFRKFSGLHYIPLGGILEQKDAFVQRFNCARQEQA